MSSLCLFLHPLCTSSSSSSSFSASLSCSNSFPWRLVTFWQQRSLPSFLPSLVSSLILPLIQQSKFTRLVHIHHILISLASAHFGGPGRVGPLPLWRAGYNETRPQSVNNSPLLKREMERVLLTLMWMWTRKDASDDKKKNKKHPSRTFKRLFPSTVTRDFIRL